jgi:hypothetical protein
MTSDSSLHVFAATGKLQSYVVPATGRYVIEAAGAQGGPGGGPGGKGARLRGVFELNAGDILQVVVGLRGGAGDSAHQPAGGGGGGSFVWKGGVLAPLPAKPMLAAGGGGGGSGGGGVVALDAGRGAVPGGRNGHGGSADAIAFHFSGGGGTGWLSCGASGSAPLYCAGGTHWSGGAGADFCGNRGGDGGFGGGGGGAFLGCGAGGGGGFSGGGGGTQIGPSAGGGGSFNGGRQQINTGGVQEGHGFVSIMAATAAVLLLTPAGLGGGDYPEAGSLPEFSRYFAD